MRKWQDDFAFFVFVFGLILAGGECKPIDNHTQSVVQLKHGWETGHHEGTAGDLLVVSPPLLSERLSLKKGATGFERVLKERGFRHEPALLCILATAYHESSFRPAIEVRERDGSISRGLLQMNSRGMGRGIDRKRLLTIAGQVETLSKHHGFLRWYKEVKTKNLDVATAMKKLTDNIIRCAKKYRAARITTVRNWEAKLQSE